MAVWSSKMFVFPESKIILTAFISSERDKRQVYFSVNNIFRLLGYNGTPNKPASYVDKSRIVAVTEAAMGKNSMIRGHHDRIYFFESSYAVELLQNNEFYKPGALLTAPKLLKFIESEVLPSCLNKLEKLKSSKAKMSEVCKILQAGMSLFNDAAKILAELEERSAANF